MMTITLEKSAIETILRVFLRKRHNLQGYNIKFDWVLGYNTPEHHCGAKFTDTAPDLRRVQVKVNREMEEMTT